MIRREVDASLINAIANHPDVLPHFDLSRSGSLDFSECIARPEDYIILSNGVNAIGVFEWSAPRVWQGHTMFHPDCRGKRAIEAGRAICAALFEHGAEMLWGQTPTIMRHVRWFNRQIGFAPAGIGFHHISGEVERFVMRKPDGRTSDCSSRDFSRQ